MSYLTKNRIEELASKPEVKKNAVKNFLSTMCSDNTINYANLEFDAKLYKWNEATIEAISTGISENVL